MTETMPALEPVEQGEAVASAPVAPVTPESVQAGQGRAIDTGIAAIEQRVNASQADRQIAEGTAPDPDLDTDTAADTDAAAPSTPAAPAGSDKKAESWWVGLLGSLSTGFNQLSTWLGEKGGKFGDWLGKLLGLKPKDESTQPVGYAENVKALMKEFKIEENKQKGGKELARANFYSVSVKLAREVEAKYGVPWKVCVAQACLESGFGQSELTQKALNCFGHTKGSANVPSITMEGEDFRSYTSLRESFMDYGQLLSGSDKYKEAFNHKDDPKRFLEEVLKGGYATDPEYLSKVEKVIAPYGMSLSKERASEDASLLWPDAPIFSFPKSYIGKIDVSDIMGWRENHDIHGYGRPHNGMDIPALENTPILLSANGAEVIHQDFQETINSRSGKKDGAGYYVTIKDTNGVEATFMHLSRPGPAKGTKLKRGDVIGYVGKTGGATGPHIHYEIKVNGGRIDPTPYLSDQLVAEAKKEKQERGVA